MAELLEAEDFITEQQFEDIVRGKKLTEIERESLRKFYGLPCNEKLLSVFTFWREYAVVAWQKIRGNPLLCR